MEQGTARTFNHQDSNITQHKGIKDKLSILTYSHKTCIPQVHMRMSISCYIHPNSTPNARPIQRLVKEHACF
jgi:hypothetical protein